MFIDIHARAYRFPGPPQDGTTIFATPKQVLKRYDELKIDVGVLLPLKGKISETVFKEIARENAAAMLGL